MGSKQPSSGGNANSIMVQIQDKARVRTYDELSHILQEGQELEVNMSVAARLDAAKRRLQEKYDKVYSAGSPKRQRVMIGPGRASSKPVIISVPTSADTEIYCVAYEPEYVCLELEPGNWNPPPPITSDHNLSVLLLLPGRM